MAGVALVVIWNLIAVVCGVTASVCTYAVIIRHGGGEIGGPYVRRPDPAVVTDLLVVTRLDWRTVEGELLPELRADGENPAIHVCRVDLGPERQRDEPALVSS